MGQTHPHYRRILTVFPDADPASVKRLCCGAGNTEEDFIRLVERYLEEQEINAAYRARLHRAAPPPNPVARAAPPNPVARAAPPNPVARAPPPNPVACAPPPNPVARAPPLNPVARTPPPNPVACAPPPNPVARPPQPNPVARAPPPNPVIRAPQLIPVARAPPIADANNYRQATVAPHERVNITLDTLYELLPDADRKYLSEKFQTFAGDQEKLQTFVDDAVQKSNYPTIAETQRKEKLLAQVREYTTDFNVRKFISMFPDPKAHFEDPQRKPAVWGTGFEYVLLFLRNEFLLLPEYTIETAVRNSNCDLIKTVNALKLFGQGNVRKLKFRRRFCRLPDTVDNIPLLQEIAYIRFQWRINNYLKDVRAREARERKAAQTLNLMKTCNCCYEDELLPSATVTCPKGCRFCKKCVQKSVEIAYGVGKLDFPCLSDCGRNFNLKMLQQVMEPNLFAKLALKKQTEEIKACGIDEVEMCPFCDFATIPIKGDQLFRCSNPDCLRESCRLCKEPSHIPLRCDEVEKEDEVKRRVYIENKMSEALIRKCNKCGLAIIKEDGCNKMTCSCGALMCYICRKTIQNYSHFDQTFNPTGINFTPRTGLCPLYSKDLDGLHKENVMTGVQQAKAELGLNADPTKLKYDPKLP